MLVLTRKLQERIRIGDNVVVTVLRVRGNAVRLGIEAPDDVAILRGELPRFDEEPQEAPAADSDGPAIADADDSEPEPADEPIPHPISLAARVQQRVQALA